MPLGEPVELIYAIRALFGRESTDGFDAVPHSDPRQKPLFRRLQMGDPPADVEPDSVAVDPEGLTLFLPRRVISDEELRNRAGKTTPLHGFRPVRGQGFQPRTVFAPAADTRRRRYPGNRGPTSFTWFAEGEAGKSLLADLVFSSATLTANGDGRNDRLQIRYTLFGVIFHRRGGNLPRPGRAEDSTP